MRKIKRKNKRAAMEMSVGTIVTIVLLMAVLILGLSLIRTIFTSGKGVVDLTDQQLRSEINKLFSEEEKVVIYPGTRFLEISPEETDGFGIGIQNLLTGTSGDQRFDYEVLIDDDDLEAKCGGVSEETVIKWIVTGRTGNDIPIPVKDTSYQQVLFTIPSGAPLCTIRFRVNIQAGGNAYASEFFNLQIA